MIKYATLREANAARQELWDPAGHAKDLDWRCNELGGEAGEVCNILKKLHRERLGIPGSRATVEQLAEELADVIICTDLVAMQCGYSPVNFIGPDFRLISFRSLPSAGVLLLLHVGRLCGHVTPGDLRMVAQIVRSIATHENIGLGYAVERKFNATSEKVGLPVRLEMTTGAAASESFMT